MGGEGGEPGGDEQGGAFAVVDSEDAGEEDRGEEPDNIEKEGGGGDSGEGGVVGAGAQLGYQRFDHQPDLS